MKKLGKRLILFLCLTGLVMMFTACRSEEKEDENKYSVYYVSSSETKVETHDHILESDTLEGQLEEMVHWLSATPERLEYKAPFAMGFQLLDMEAEDGKLLIDVDKEYLNLSPTTEVLVRAAIVRTLTQLQGVNYVGITVEGEQLYDNTGKLVGWMNADRFIHNNGNEINTYELTRVKLYFANESGDALIAAYREKYYSTNTSKERFIVEELISGPSGQIPGLYATINPETKIVNVMTKDGICYVNLDEKFLTMTNNVSKEVAVYSIVNSLVELSSVNKVQILVNGEVPSLLSTSTFERNLDYVTTLEQYKQQTP